MADGQTPADAPASEAPSNATTDPKPAPWGDDFDPERAWKTIQNLREAEKAWKAEKASADEERRKREDAEKTEAQKAAERADRAEKDASDARREALVLKAGVKHGIPEDLLDLVTGDTAEQIEERAARLAERLAATPQKPAPPTRPEPRLTTGENPGSAEDGDFDPEALAAQIRRSQR